MTKDKVVRKYRGVNVYVTDEEWHSWRVWLAEHNTSGSRVLASYLRRVIGRSGRKSASVVGSKSRQRI